MKVLCFKNILREIRSHLYISKMCAFTMLKKCIQKLPAMFMICVIVWYCGCTCSAVCIVKVYPLIDTQHHDRCVGVEQAVKLIIRYCRRLGYTELQHSLRPVLVTTRTLKFYQTSLLSLSLSLSRQAATILKTLHIGYFQSSLPDTWREIRQHWDHCVTLLLIQSEPHLTVFLTPSRFSVLTTELELKWFRRFMHEINGCFAITWLNHLVKFIDVIYI